MINHLGVKHISFDLWLTLIRSNKEFKPLRADLLIKHFSVKIPKPIVYDVVNEYDRLFNSINETLGRNLDTYEILLIILHNVGVDTHKVSIERLENFYAEMEDLFMEYHPILIDSNTKTILSNLTARGISLSILSNTAFIKGKTINKILRKLEIAEYFDFCIYSDEIGHSKPSSFTYSSTLSKIRAIKSIRLDQVLHVGDNIIADYEGAKKFGFHAQLINVNGKTLSDLFLN